MLDTSSSRNKHGGDQDFEINIASIIDCFTVLITYLLVSASFISIGMLDVSIATPGPAIEVENNPISLTIDVDTRNNMTLFLTGADSAKISISSKNNTLDAETLENSLNGIRTKFPQLNIAQISSAPTVEYRTIVMAVETARKVMPSVYFGDRPERNTEDN